MGEGDIGGYLWVLCVKGESGWGWVLGVRGGNGKRIGV